MRSWGPELAAAEAAARAAGEVLLRMRGTELRPRAKADGTLVTEADLAAEQAICTALHAAFPEAPIHSEESAPSGSSGSGGRRWIVDPLDGTTNYSRDLPMFAVSVALWEGDRPRVAAVLLPVLGELFTAVAEGPALRNGEPIRVSATTEVARAMVNVYFDRRGGLEKGLCVFEAVARRCEGRVKIMGSTAALLCFTACGRLDGFVRTATKVHDFAAGRLVLERAGGRLSDFDGRALMESGQSLVAANGWIHEELREIARGAACGVDGGAD